MPTIIDSLLVKLGFDNSGMQSGANQAKKHVKDVGDEAKRTQGSVKDATRTITAFLALLGGSAAIKAFVVDLTESNAALDRLGQNLGDSTSRISAWSGAVQVAGGSAEGLQGTLDMLSRSQTELQLTGQSALIPYFYSLGIGLTQAGKARPAAEMLLELAERFSKMDRPTANNMGRMMGIDQGTMNLLLKGRPEVELMLRRQKELGVVTAKQAEESSRLRAAMVEGKLALSAFGREILSAVTPALESLLEHMKDLSAWAKDNAVAIGIVAAGAMVLISPLTALGVALVALWEDFDTWKKGGESLIPWEKWKPQIDMAVNGIRMVRDALMDAGFRMAAFAIMTQEYFFGDKKKAKRAAEAMMSGMPTARTEAAAPPAGGDALSYFVSKGWTREQASGIVANLHAESGMRPEAVGDNGKAYGIAQWHPDRQAAFARFAGKDIRQSTLQEQLAFVNYELTRGAETRAGNALRGAVTAGRAGEIVSRQYERPANADAEAAKRGAMARRIWAGVPGASGAAQAPSAGVAGASNSVTTTIGEVHVHTAATDSEGISRDMAQQLNYALTAQANSGMAP